MTPSLRPRIVAALRLGFPLTSAELQRMLMASEPAIRRGLKRIGARPVGFGQAHGRGRPVLWGLSTGDKK